MTENPIPTPQKARYLMYFADPMCSWCWGFAPAIAHLQENYGDTMEVRLILGGLRPGHMTPMDDDAKREMRSHWEQVQQTSGQAFNFDFFARDGYVYNTEPACRAVVAARRLNKTDAIPMLKALQRAFYEDGRDTTQTDELATVASDIGIDVDAFRAEFDDIDTMDETRNDFWLAKKTGVDGFPALIAFDRGEAQAVTMGFSPWEELGPALKGWLDR